MIHVFTKNISRIIRVFPLAFVWALLIPSLAIADPESQPCTITHLQIEHTKKNLLASEQRQQQLQQDVHATYQELFACKAGRLLSMTQQQYCSHLQEEGPKQFQAMIEVTTLNHQITQRLALQTSQAQLICPGSSEGSFQKKTSLVPMQKIVMN